jgi:hypothetical protein
VSEHLCQGDWGGNFSKGNSSLWQIWPRVSVFLFLIFQPRERGHTCERSHTCEGETGRMCERKRENRPTCAILYSLYHTCGPVQQQKQAACVSRTVQTVQQQSAPFKCTTCAIQVTSAVVQVTSAGSYNRFASWKGFSRIFTEVVIC